MAFKRDIAHVGRKRVKKRKKKRNSTETVAKHRIREHVTQTNVRFVVIFRYEIIYSVHRLRPADRRPDGKTIICSPRRDSRRRIGSMTIYDRHHSRVRSVPASRSFYALIRSDTRHVDRVFVSDRPRESTASVTVRTVPGGKRLSADGMIVPTVTTVRTTRRKR